jgi:hypothetical protein
MSYSRYSTTVREWNGVQATAVASLSAIVLDPVEQRFFPLRSMGTLFGKVRRYYQDTSGSCNCDQDSRPICLNLHLPGCPLLMERRTVLPKLGEDLRYCSSSLCADIHVTERHAVTHSLMTEKDGSCTPAVSSFNTSLAGFGTLCALQLSSPTRRGKRLTVFTVR